MVFVFAGTFALSSAIFLGKRPGRFTSEFEHNFAISNPPIYILGCFLTILGVFGIAAAQQPDLIARSNSLHNL